MDRRGREREATELADYAAACGARALVLVPLNDGSGRANGERQGNLRVALKALRPILSSRGIAGFVEPLGFETCSLRSKKEAADAIAGGWRRPKPSASFTTPSIIVLPASRCRFLEMTGLVHISGVVDAAVSVSDMRDPHRVLVDRDDRIGNVAQMRALLAGGYTGPFSFEPFAPSVHELPAPAEAIVASMQFVTSEIARRVRFPRKFRLDRLRENGMKIPSRKMNGIFVPFKATVTKALAKEGEAGVSKGIRAGDGNPERVPMTDDDPSGGLS